MKERPILFSAAMVKAILDGRKTQTRRVVKPQPILTREAPVKFPKPKQLYVCPDLLPTSNDHKLVLAYCEDYGTVHYMGQQEFAKDFCPYGSIGDRLWVRENWYYDVDLEVLPKTKPANLDPSNLYYPADARRGGKWCCELIPECCCGEVGKPRVRPSIHMPRWASRITLEITGVKVERLNGISEEDAKAEGAQFIQYGCCGTLSGYKSLTNSHNPAFILARDWFKNLWGSINGEDSWAANPWVWALTFKVVQP